MYFGFYEREITPPIGCDMPGYYSERLSIGVLDKLYAKVLLISEDKENLNNAVALISVDAVELNRDFCEKVSLRAEKLTGIKSENVSVTATHTHLGVPSGDPVSKKDDGFMDMLALWCADLVLNAKANLTLGSMSFSEGKVKDIAFIRDYYLTDGTICTNPGGALKDKIIKPYSEFNEELYLLSFKDTEGKLLGAIWEFACHQDCVGGLKYSGDYSSEVARCLKDKFGKAFVSVYFPGASGDINNLDFIGGKTKSYIEMGKIIAAEISDIIEKGEEIKETKIKINSDRVDVKIRRATESEKARAQIVVDDPENNKDIHVMLGKTMAWLLLDFEKEMENKPCFESLPIKVINIDDLYIFILPGEIYHQFESKIREEYKNKKVFVTTLSNSEGGYFPIPEVFGTYVYPTQLCRGSRFIKEGGDILINKAVELAKNL